MAYLITHVTTALAALAAFVMVLGLVRTQRTPQSTLAWLLGLVFLPFVAIPLYFLLGARKFPRRAKLPALSGAAPRAAHAPPIARVLEGSGVAAPTPGNHFELIASGEAAYPRLLELIARAEHSIDLTTFILGWDETGKSLVAALAERAARGVQVRVILDAVGCLRSRGPASRLLSQAGAEVRLFMPLSHAPWRGRNNLRSHRKLIVFDGRTLFTGGMNLALEYLGARNVPTPEPRWRDVAAVCEGPVVRGALDMFDSDWRYSGGKTPRRASATTPSATGDALAQFVPSGPDFVTDTIYDLFLAAIFAARERIALIAPYYVPDDALQHALVLAARRGIHTEVVVPSVSNHSLADVARRGLLRELAAAGVVIRYYPNGMVHAKAMAIDDAFAYVGSPNFDMRSLFLNYENALCVYSPRAVAEVRAFIDALAAECVTEAPTRRHSPVLEQLARFLTPEL